MLGGTGSIGAAVIDALLLRGHEVAALARSDAAAARLPAVGVRTLRGDIRDPGRWIASVDSVGAVVHAAAGFVPDDATIDRTVLKALLSRLGNGNDRRTLLYTGGCWL